MRKHHLPRPGALFGAYPERTSAPAGNALIARLRSALGSNRLYARRRAQQLARSVQRVHAHLASLPGFPGEGLQQALHAARAGMSRDGLRSDAALRCMACVLVCIRSVSGCTLRDNQIMAALSVLRGELAEMPTGEGKTLATALAAATAALAGIPVHVVTANDYLAGRDAEALRPIYRLLGLSVAALAPGLRSAERRSAYACELSYCSAKELVFDYLRDSLLPPAASDNANTASARVLRGLCMAIIDEADSVLIDEALTPFILSESYSDATQLQMCRQALQIAAELHAGQDFKLQGSELSLLPAGQQRIATHAECADAALWRVPRYREELLLQALRAQHLLLRDEHYIVREGKVLIIDPHSGRVAEGRSWSRGLQQMVEIKEDCAPTPATRVIAQISFQAFFPRYHLLGGMSGTLAEARGELLAFYDLAVQRIPAHRPSLRRLAPPRIFGGREARWAQVLAAIKACHARGRPVLIGTDSVRDSEYLSQLLAAQQLPHRVLNARQDREEAQLIAAAGAPAAITVATNMAGRGTDIEISADIAALGGLHVISCQHNSARRIDRQLHGRAARQGQPGSAETLLSLDEGLLARALPPPLRRFLQSLFSPERELPLKLAKALFGLAQWIEERRSRQQRKLMWQRDRAMQAQLHFRPQSR
jgi:preprotein translocase subunit SecA